MKWLRTLVLFDKGNVISSEDWKSVHTSYVRAIASIDHPAGAGKLRLRDKRKSQAAKWPVEAQWRRLLARSVSAVHAGR